MQEVTFHSRQLRKILHLKSEAVRDIGDGRSVVIPALMVSFEDGVYRTMIEDEVNRIRQTPAYLRKEVFEVSPADVEAVRIAQQQERQKTIRGPITSQTIAQEAGVKLPEEKRTTLAGKNTTKCDICDKEFENDLAGRKIRMHKLGAHRSKK